MPLRTRMGQHHGHMPGIRIPSRQLGIRREAFAVTAGLAEPTPGMSNICQAMAFSASQLPDASEGHQLSWPKLSSVNITAPMFDFTGNTKGRRGFSCSELAIYLQTMAQIQDIYPLFMFGWERDVLPEGNSVQVQPELTSSSLSFM